MEGPKKSRKIPQSKYSFDLSFFKSWSPEMAYVLGYFTADGCLREYKRKVVPTHYSLNFSSKDRDLLEQVAPLLGDAPIRKTSPQGNTIWYLDVPSRELGRDLLALGLRPRKSLTLKKVTVDSAYFWHFLRGYMDGDGTVCLLKGGSYIILGFCSGSKPLLSTLPFRSPEYSILLLISSTICRSVDIRRRAL